MHIYRSRFMGGGGVYIYKCQNREKPGQHAYIIIKKKMKIHEPEGSNEILLSIISLS